jgi:antitoxin ParD1/3/4
MATMNVSLTESMKAWVKSQAEGGDLIRKDQERKAAIEVLQAAITQGLQSGEPQPFDPAAFKLRMRERHVVR